MTEFKWLQLTDLHIGDHPERFSSIAHALLKDLRDHPQDVGPCDFVLITGDLTYSARADDYAVLDDFLDRRLIPTLTDLSSGRRPIVLAVPGNHDVSWLHQGHPSAEILQSYETDPQVREWFWSAAPSVKTPYRSGVSEAFRNYVSWWTRRGPIGHPDFAGGDLPGDFSFVYHKDRTPLRIVGLNTATFQLLKTSPATGRSLDSRQYQCLPEASSDPPIVSLLLTHHPAEELGHYSQEECRSELNGFALHLCGHRHVADKITVIHGGDDGRRRWIGDSLCGFDGSQDPSSRNHGFSVGRISIDSSGYWLQQWPRQISRQQNGEWKGVPNAQVVGLDYASGWAPRETVKTPVKAVGAAVPTSLPPHTDMLADHDVAERLQRRYGIRKIHIARPVEFAQCAGRALAAAIRDVHSERLSQDQDRPLISVGVVCGPMTTKIVGQLAKEPDFDSGRFRVRFVALNKAAVFNAFQHSASYLATSLSLSIPQAEATAYTHNAYEHPKILDCRKQVDIILCSAGAYPSTPQSYLEMWHEAMKLAVSIPDDCVGDFCLTPIDDTGRATGSVELHKLLRDSIDPYPTFQRMSDLISSQVPRTRILVPLQTSDTTPTGKEAVARAILRSGAIDVSVVTPRLAECLDKGIGGFLIRSVSRASEHGFRVCSGHDFRQRKERNDIVVFDPEGRLSTSSPSLEDLCPPRPWGERIPDVIFSERGRLESFSADSTQSDIRLEDQNVSFKFADGTRPPGIWSLVLYQLCRKYVGQLSRANRPSAKTAPKFWDVGCGCGVVGLLLRLAQPEVSLFFSDTSASAIENTRANIIAHTRGHAAATQVATGSLLEPFPDERDFEVIAFNPPFLADGLGFGVPRVDTTGAIGCELACEFAGAVFDRLSSGGYAIVGAPDYVDRGELKESLHARFGAEHVRVERRTILYPSEPAGGFPKAYEVRHRKAIENTYGYRFERLEVGGMEFVSFEMRHYVAQRSPTKRITHDRKAARA